MHTKKFEIGMASGKNRNLTIKLKGDVDSTTLMKLFDLLERVEQVRIFLFDLSCVKTLGSTGVGKLQEMVEVFEKQGKRIGFVNLNKQVQIVFTMMGVNQTFRVFKTVDEALTQI